MAGVANNVAAAVVLGIGLVAPAYAPGDATPQSGSAKPGPAEFDDHRIPAGTELQVRLRTPLDSSSTPVDEQVDAVLSSPVARDGRVLIPAGSLVIGRVLSVVRASERTPLGSVTCEFTILEHAGTRDRAMLHAQKLVVEAPRAAGGGSRPRARRAQAVMPAGTPFVVVTEKPLIVRIPR